MKTNKATRPVPVGLYDYWNWNRDTTKHPKTQPDYPKFSAQEYVDAMKHLHEYGFGG